MAGGNSNTYRSLLSIALAADATHCPLSPTFTHWPQGRTHLIDFFTVALPYQPRRKEFSAYPELG